MWQIEMGNNIKQLVEYKKKELMTSDFWYNIGVQKPPLYSNNRQKAEQIIDFTFFLDVQEK